MALMKGWKGVVLISNTSAGLASAGNVECISAPGGYDAGVEAAFVMGQRTPKEIMPGNIALSGTITRYFDNIPIVEAANASVTLAIAAGIEQTTNVSTFYIKVLPNGSGGGVSFTYNAVKFGGWNFDHTQGGIVTESANWMAESCNISTG